MRAGEWSRLVEPVVAPWVGFGPLPGLVLGAVVGSFLGVIFVRLPQGRSVLGGRSACDHCAAPLSPVELIPIVSWLVQRGRCRRCGGSIGLWPLAIECGGALVGAIASVAAPPGLVLAAMLLGWQLFLIALIDGVHLWLPRALTLLLAVTGAATVIAHGGGEPKVFIPNIAAGVCGYGTLWLVALAYRLRRGKDGMGGGDPALLGAIGLWLGPHGLVLDLLFGSLVGLAVALGLMVGGRKPKADTMLPLGTCLAVAAWPIFLVGGFG